MANTMNSKNVIKLLPKIEINEKFTRKCTSFLSSIFKKKTNKM